jgi:hypothetical protein
MAVSHLAIQNIPSFRTAVSVSERTTPTAEVRCLIQEAPTPPSAFSPSTAWSRSVPRHRALRDMDVDGPPPERRFPAKRRIAGCVAWEQSKPRMISPVIRTLVNPRPQAIRLILSDGSERVVPAWGLTVLPRSDAAGHPIEVVQALYLERRRIPGQLERPA